MFQTPTSAIRPLCPCCWQQMVYTKITVGGQFVFWVYLCDCVPQPIVQADIQQARREGAQLEYSIEIKNGG